MKRETIAIHAGYEPDAAVRSVAVPIYQTVAFAFDSSAQARNGTFQPGGGGLPLYPHQ